MKRYLKAFAAIFSVVCLLSGCSLEESTSSVVERTSKVSAEVTTPNPESANTLTPEPTADPIPAPTPVAMDMASIPAFTDSAYTEINGTQSVHNTGADDLQHAVPRQKDTHATGDKFHTQPYTIDSPPDAALPATQQAVTKVSCPHTPSWKVSERLARSETFAEHEVVPLPDVLRTAETASSSQAPVNNTSTQSAENPKLYARAYSGYTQSARTENHQQSKFTVTGKSVHSAGPRSIEVPAHSRQATFEGTFHTDGMVQLNTWDNNPITNGLHSQGAALAVSKNSGAAVQSFQAAGQAVGSAGASTAANAAGPGVAAAVQVTEKVMTKAKESIENIAASAPKNVSTMGALAALFLMPLLFLMAIAGALRGGGPARNVGLSEDVIALIPQISAACQANGIPEYVPLVAAVIMQESGGRVADVGGDVMQCAEGMGLPVGTPVSLDESINFGTSIIAENLRLAGAAGPTDIPAISLALQGYNFGNGYISWAQARGGYSKENVREFSEMQAAAHGWSGYGDIEYVDHVLHYYQVSIGGMGDASAIADGRFAFPFPGHTWNTYPGHNGIDIAFADIYGEPVYAVADGMVRYTQDGWVPAYGVGGMWSFGNSVFVDHGDGWISAYAHLSALAVSPGEYITQGQLVGYVGSTGNSTGPHLHLALYHNGEAGIGGQNYAELAWPQH
ncbi:peptidoglycan DD-metalloendopeptidase family protein [Acutalibacter muris]|uniref:peptidoglycan DD-metalloendopeptidase family protein n=1 Tax=Acutalibacter muris TaxID=1796620 RepID=UPI0026F39365|nr:peptidoglycan DD-metalloendopeptidase family protein [Acutalibacter muris]